MYQDFFMYLQFVGLFLSIRRSDPIYLIPRPVRIIFVIQQMYPFMFKLRRYLALIP